MVCLWILFIIMKLQETESTLRPCDDPHFAGENIALDQYSEQSGDYFGQASSNAVDGNTDTSAEYGTCAHTIPSSGTSWWRVFFDEPYIITGIIIYSRSNALNRFRLENFEITGYEEGFHWGRTLYNDSKLQQYNDRIILVPIDEIKYSEMRFTSVKITVPPNYHTSVDDGFSMLTICEVEIYTPVTINVTGTDLVNAEVTDTPTKNSDTSVCIVVGVISGIGGVVIATTILLTIWFVKYRSNDKEKRYTDLHNVDRTMQSYDQITSAPAASSDRQTGEQGVEYEMVV